MTDCYGPLAGRYDALTGDVPYEAFADWYETAFARQGGAVHTVLDLCCGTGTLSLLLARRGYELIGADASAEMLSEFQRKAADLPPDCIRPLLLCQRAEELDLYGTVDAAYSSLDSFSYLPRQAMPDVLRRLHLFVRPGGLLIFDIRTEDFLRGMDAQAWVDETEDVLCLWRGRFDEETMSLVYGMDIFTREGEYWRRDCEEHVEYVHRPEELRAELEKAGFTDVRAADADARFGPGRMFIWAKRDER